jgi:hypothetical protein
MKARNILVKSILCQVVNSVQSCSKRGTELLQMCQLLSWS